MEKNNKDGKEKKIKWRKKHQAIIVKEKHKMYIIIHVYVDLHIHVYEYL